MKEQLYDYDPSSALDNQEAIALFMADAFETGDAAYIAKALDVVARALRTLNRKRHHIIDGISRQ